MKMQLKDVITEKLLSVRDKFSEEEFDVIKRTSLSMGEIYLEYVMGNLTEEGYKKECKFLQAVMAQYSDLLKVRSFEVAKEAAEEFAGSALKILKNAIL